MKTAPQPEHFKPAKDRILIFPEDTEEKSAGGIMLPDSAKERPQVGKVISRGPDAALYPVGSLVLYGKTAGIKIDFEVARDGDGDPEYREFWLMRESEIFGEL